MAIFQGNNRIISAKSPGSLVTFDEVFAEVKLSLFNLKEMAAVTNFFDAAEKKNYRDNLSVLCEFYTRAEYLLLNGEGVRSMPVVTDDADATFLKNIVQKTPLAQQMSRWTEKLLANLTRYEQIKDEQTVAQKVAFVREQYVLLYAGYRVLSGHAVFVGAC